MGTEVPAAAAEAREREQHITQSHTNDPIHPIQSHAKRERVSIVHKSPRTKLNHTLVLFSKKIVLSWTGRQVEKYYLADTYHCHHRILTGRS